MRKTDKVPDGLRFMKNVKEFRIQICLSPSNAESWCWMEKKGKTFIKFNIFRVSQFLTAGGCHHPEV